MPRQLTKAERYKRNYRIIKNAYANSTLAKRSQTWSDERIYNELGLKVTGVKTPQLKKLTTRQITRKNREFTNFIYAKEKGLSPKEARKSRFYRRTKIDSTVEYVTTKEKKFNLKNKHKRMDLWSEWSRKFSPFPPDIQKYARDLNRETIVGGKPLDDEASYGYVVAFYLFVENKTFDEIKDLVKQDPHDAYRVIYKTTVSV